MIDPQVATSVRQHNLRNDLFLHTNLEATICACRGITLTPPNMTGEFCTNCSGMMVRTGTCTTCTECGNTGGCG